MNRLLTLIRPEPPMPANLTPQSLLESSLFKFDRQAEHLAYVQSTKEAQHKQLAEDLRVVAIIQEGNEFVRNKLAQLDRDDAPRAYLAAE